MKTAVFALTALLTVVGQSTGVPTPEQFFGFRIGTDNKLARWDKIVEYMRQVASASDRVRFRELGKSTNDHPFIALEIASPAEARVMLGLKGRDQVDF